MQSSPALVPFLRSDTQARILAALLLVPDREAPIAELAERAGTSRPNAMREVNKLVQAGVLTDRHAGRTRLVRANPDNRYTTPLAQILSWAYGPAQVIRDHLTAVPGIEQALIYGSYAARYQGHPGPTPNDIDVLVVGDPPGRELRRAASDIETVLQTPVQMVTVTTDEWEQAESGFLRDVQSKPTIPLDLGATT